VTSPDDVITEPEMAVETGEDPPSKTEQ
jgi:hypothetical protein